jgi:hypothetical protein
LDAGLEALFAEGETLEFGEAVFLGGAVNNSVFEDVASWCVDDGFSGAVSIAPVFEMPCVSPLVVIEFGIVVAFVEVLKDGGEDLGLLVWQVDPFLRGLEEGVSAG